MDESMPSYRYRARGEIGNPDSSIVEDVQLSVGPDGETGVRIAFRSEQFPAGEVTLSPEQTDHLAAVLAAIADADDLDGHGDGLTDADGTVVHPDGHVDGDEWDVIR